MGTFAVNPNTFLHFNLSYMCLIGIFYLCNTVIIIGEEHENSCLLKIFALLSLWQLWFKVLSSSMPQECLFRRSPMLPHWGWNVHAQQSAPRSHKYLFCGWVLGFLGYWCPCWVSWTLNIYVSHSISSLGLILTLNMFSCSMLCKRKEHRTKEKMQEIDNNESFGW